MRNNDIFWNDDDSYDPTIAIDSNNNIHVAWEDETDGVWGTDDEIMYANYEESTGWSNVTVISDGYGNNTWNDDDTEDPAIVVGNDRIIHVVWEDDTNGVWGFDSEIMYTKIEYTPPSKSDGAIPFSNFYLVPTFIVILGIVIHIRRKKQL